LQSYSVWSVSVAVVGHLCNASGAYAFDDTANSNGYCIAEAVSLTFGELALVLWQICSAVTAVVIMHPEWLSNEARARHLFAAFHVCVWTPSLVTTVIPWATGMDCSLLASDCRDACDKSSQESRSCPNGDLRFFLFMLVRFRLARLSVVLF
jgi:hypothetical protein